MTTGIGGGAHKVVSELPPAGALQSCRTSLPVGAPDRSARPASHNREGIHGAYHPRRRFLTIGVTAAIAQANVIQQRQALMKQNGQATRTVSGMLRGQTPSISLRSRRR